MLFDMQVFYLSKLELGHTQVIFPEEESRHLSKVLRKKPGDLVQATNGRGFLATLQLEVVLPKTCKAQVVSQHQEAENIFKVHIAIAPTKSIDRMEWFLEKATEIGIHRISPIICEHSERKMLKTERLRKILIAAMKQSQRTYLPVLDEAVSFSAFVQSANDNQKFIAHCADFPKQNFKNAIAPKRNVCVLIGPEGDFSHSEIEQAQQAGFLGVSLSEKRLRTETAAWVVTHIALLANG